MAADEVEGRVRGQGRLRRLIDIENGQADGPSGRRALGPVNMERRQVLDGNRRRLAKAESATRRSTEMNECRARGKIQRGEVLEGLLPY